MALAQSGDVQGRRRVRKESRHSPARAPPGPPCASLAASLGRGEELRLGHYVPL